MSKKNLASTRALCLLGTSISMLGFGPGILAQPPLLTFDDTISFSGSGTLYVSHTTFAQPSVPDPILSVSLSGTGQDNDNQIFSGVPL